MSARTSIGLSFALCVAFTCDRSHAQLCVPPSTPQPSVWSFLGIPQAAHGMVKVKDAVANRCGKLPCLERTPAVKALADPANIESDIPAIKAAAEVKAAEDLAPQKIKAIRYLAQIGCGCYNKDGKVTKAMLAAMEDCTEDVRRAAIEAIGDAARSEYCAYCKQRSCCNEEITQQLAKIAYDQDESGCYLEPSERVRRAAMEAMAICCPSWGPAEEAEPPSGIEEGAEPEAAEPESAPPPPDVTSNGENAKSRVPAMFASESQQGASGFIDDVDIEVIDHSARVGEQTDVGPQGEGVSGYVDDAELMLLTSAPNDGVLGYMDDVDLNVIDRSLTVLGQGDDGTIQYTRGQQPLHREAKPRGKLSSRARIPGTVIGVDRDQHLVHIQLDGDVTLPLGRRMEIYHQYLLGTEHVADLEVVGAAQGLVNACPLRGSNLRRNQIGDRVRTWEDQ